MAEVAEEYNLAFKEEGLNTLDYKLISEEKHSDYKMISVEL